MLSAVHAYQVLLQFVKLVSSLLHNLSGTDQPMNLMVTTVTSSKFCSLGYNSGKTKVLTNHCDHECNVLLEYILTPWITILKY